MVSVEIKRGSELNANELEVINYWRKKEFNSNSDWGVEKTQAYHEDVFFLVKNHDQIVSFGRLRAISIFIENIKYDIWGIATVVSVIKQKGYGKMLLHAIKEYVLSDSQTVIGFCGQQNTAFYEKCGFGVINNGATRFIYEDEKGQPHYETGDVVYIKGIDGVIDALLKNKNLTVKHYMPHW